MNFVIQSVLPILFICLIGAVCERKKLVGSGTKETISRLVYFVFLPADIFHFLATTPIEKVMNIDFVAVCFFVVVTTGVIAVS